MYVCVCLAVTDSTIREAVEDGARTIACVTRRCGAGGDCGACHATIEDMIEDVTGEMPQSPGEELVQLRRPPRAA
jgi:bacterioferritin-associated ferredoxin